MATADIRKIQSEMAGMSARLIEIHGDLLKAHGELLALKQDPKYNPGAFRLEIAVLRQLMGEVSHAQYRLNKGAGI